MTGKTLDSLVDCDEPDDEAGSVLSMSAEQLEKECAGLRTATG